MLISCRPKPEPENTPSFPRTRKSTPSSVIPAHAEIQPHHPSFPRRRESTIPAHAGIHRPIPQHPKKTPRHSRARGNPTPPSVIPAKAGIHNSRACGNSSTHTPTPEKNTPSFPRTRKSTPLSVIPAKAGIHNSRACGNSSTHTPTPEKNTPSFPRTRKSTPIIRHSRACGNSSPQIPAHPTPLSVIPAKAGIHNSRACGNSSTHTPTPEKNTPSFPRTRKSTPSSVIPAQAGIHTRACGNSSTHSRAPRHSRARGKSPTPFPRIRHSREGGNPQFPRMREFIDPYPNTRKKYSVIPAHAEIHPTIRHSRERRNPPPSVIPAKAGIHNSRACGNSSTHTPTPEKNTPSFPRTRPFRHSRLRRNDGDMADFTYDLHLEPADFPPQFFVRARVDRWFLWRRGIIQSDSKIDNHGT